MSWSFFVIGQGDIVFFVIVKSVIIFFGYPIKCHCFLFCHKKIRGTKFVSKEYFNNIITIDWLSYLAEENGWLTKEAKIYFEDSNLIIETEVHGFQIKWSIKITLKKSKNIFNLFPEIENINSCIHKNVYVKPIKNLHHTNTKLIDNKLIIDNSELFVLSVNPLDKNNKEKSLIKRIKNYFSNNNKISTSITTKTTTRKPNSYEMY